MITLLSNLFAGTAGRVLPRLAALAFFSGMLVPLLAQPPSKEYPLKAVLLWRLAQYTEFPKNALGPEAAPFVIAVIGENPFGDALSLAVKGETVHGREVKVMQVPDGAVPREAHVIFIAQSERTHVRSLIAGLRGRSVLTVSDIDDFARSDNGMVQFASEKNRIALQVNLDAINAVNLKIDSRVLRMADIVKGRR